MNNFFIIGLPRTRSAWLANFLTGRVPAPIAPGGAETVNVLCHHEAMRTVSNLDELAAKLADERYDIVGDADPTLCPILPEVLEKFPGAKFVFVRRPVDEVLRSHQAAFPRLDLPEIRMRKWNDAMDEAISTLDRGQRLEVKFESLELSEVCNGVHRFCLGAEMDFARWALLDGMRTTTMAEKAVSTLAPWARVAVSEMSNPLPEPCKRWYQLTGEMCGGSPTGQCARQWLSELWAAAMLWDHLMDRDPVNLAQAELVFEAMLLKWPVNAFWLKHAPILAPVLSNALSAWRHGGREREYDIYSESALAVAFILAGADYAKQWSERIRAAAAAMREQDDLDDPPTLGNFGAARLNHEAASPQKGLI